MQAKGYCSMNVGRSYRAAAGALIVLALFALAPYLEAQSASNREQFDTMHIGAFDPDGWNGVVFDGTAHGQRLTFALRIGSKSGGFIDGDRVFEAVAGVGPHAPDGSYATMSWRHAPRTSAISLEWARVDAMTVVGRIKAPAGVHLVIEGYSPFEAVSTASFRTDSSKNEIAGSHYIDGHPGTAAQFILRTDRSPSGAATFADVAQLRSVMDVGGLANTGAEVPPGSRNTPDELSLKGAAGVEFVADGDAPTHFVATVGFNAADLSARAGELLTPGQIDRILSENSKRYEQARPRVDGLFAGASYPIGNTMFWNTLYVPSIDLEFPSISRRWAKGFGGWVVGEWDCFFGTLLTNVEDPAQSSAATRAILLAQAPNGVVPNMDGGSGTSPDRSQPPVGSYAVWKNYQKNQDKALLEWAYPRLKRWHEWWFSDRGDGQPARDGNRDGLLEWGSDRGSIFSVGGRGNLVSAKWESGMDDSPMYDDVRYDPKTFTIDMDDVGLNSLYALDSECMARIAEILGKEDDRRIFAADYDRMRESIQKLWNDKDGMYENRYWDGRFSSRLSPTNFYPLIAGVATTDQAKKMIERHLLNSDEFWGKYVIPTIARNDPSFADQYYWRGNIWGPTNYLVYEGLNRYGADKTALEFAEKSYDLFMSDWKQIQHSNENYSPLGGSSGGDPHYTWGALLCLISLEQFIDVTPWDGLRFGALNPPSAGTLSNYEWNHHGYTIAIGPDRTSIERDGKPWIEANAGVVFRNVNWGTSTLSFKIDTVKAANVTIHGSASKLIIDNRAAKPVAASDESTTVTIPMGQHDFSGSWK
jgi:putative isomerase